MYVHARAPWSCLPAGMSHMFTRRSTSVDVVGRLLLLLLLLSSSSSSSSSEAIALVLLVRIPRCVMPVWGPGISISINRTVQRRRRRDREARFCWFIGAFGMYNACLGCRSTTSSRSGMEARYRFAGSNSSISLRLICIIPVWDIDQPRRSTSTSSRAIGRLGLLVHRVAIVLVHRCV